MWPDRRNVSLGFDGLIFRSQSSSRKLMILRRMVLMVIEGRTKHQHERSSGNEVGAPSCRTEKAS